MAAEVCEAVKNEAAEMEAAPLDIQSQIQNAMRSGVLHFKEQADSLTFEGVRRLLEKDLGLEKYALDVHKRFVKQCLSMCLDEAANENVCKDSGETRGKQDQAVQEKVAESCGGPGSKNDVEETCCNDEKKVEDSTVTVLLTVQKATKPATEETPANRNKEVPSEGSIKKALWKRASYIKANSDKVTMGGLRRLLEEDLKLDTYTLDPFKKFISKQLDEVLKSSEVSAPKKKTPRKCSPSKAAKQVSCEQSSYSSDKESDKEAEDEDKVKPREKIGSKQTMLNAEGSKKRKRPEKETKTSAKRRIKVETVAEDNSDVENVPNASEDGLSRSSTEKPLKKKESPTQAYGKRVEHLKSIIKSCGMSVPPSVYKKVKQVSENQREAQLIKELEDILSKEGLSSKPSEKEIKEVRKRKERAKELEGIDTSNIVLSSRRRSTASYVPPPKPKVPEESDSDDADEDEDHEEDDVNDEDDGGIDNDDDGEREESNEDNDEDSD